MFTLQRKIGLSINVCFEHDLEQWFSRFEAPSNPAAKDHEAADGTKIGSLHQIADKDEDKEEWGKDNPEIKRRFLSSNDVKKIDQWTAGDRHYAQRLLPQEGDQWPPGHIPPQLLESQIGWTEWTKWETSVA